jgi:hypothetical protein
MVSLLSIFAKPLTLLFGIDKETSLRSFKTNFHICHGIQSSFRFLVAVLWVTYFALPNEYVLGSWWVPTLILVSPGFILISHSSARLNSYLQSAIPFIYSTAAWSVQCCGHISRMRAVNFRRAVYAWAILEALVVLPMLIITIVILARQGLPSDCTRLLTCKYSVEQNRALELNTAGIWVRDLTCNGDFATYDGACTKAQVGFVVTVVSM